LEASTTRRHEAQKSGVQLSDDSAPPVLANAIAALSQVNHAPHAIRPDAIWQPYPCVLKSIPRQLRTFRASAVKAGCGASRRIMRSIAHEKMI
jgi:hypothetical protein